MPSVQGRKNEKVVEIVGPGSSFGEAMMFIDKPRSSQALVDSTLLHVSKAAVLDEQEQTPRFARKMLGGLSRRRTALSSTSKRTPSIQARSASSATC